MGHLLAQPSPGANLGRNFVPCRTLPYVPCPNPSSQVPLFGKRVPCPTPCRT
ncbi:hypothetical protein BJ165DRAFT_1496968, partial [Panaeolus papilionaceus]